MMKEYILRINEYADLSDLSIDDENIVWVNWHYPNGLGESTPEGTIRPYPSPWHTGKPTEEGWYLTKVKVDDEIVYDTNYLTPCMYGMDWRYAHEEIIEWQKLEEK